jgi:hypothetical protein
MGPLMIISGSQTYGAVMLNLGVGEHPLSANGRIFPEGIGTHAISDLRLQVKGGVIKITGACIYPDYVEEGRIVCSIWRGQDALFKSVELNATNRIQDFAIDVQPYELLSFRVDPTNNNLHQAHAAWVDIR